MVTSVLSSGKLVYFDDCNIDLEIATTEGIFYSPIFSMIKTAFKPIYQYELKKLKPTGSWDQVAKYTINTEKREFLGYTRHYYLSGLDNLSDSEKLKIRKLRSFKGLYDFYVINKVINPYSYLKL